MNFLSLFAGIGGMDLGLERSGWRCVGQVEIEPFCQKVLAKHWPDVWRWNDVKTLTAELIQQHCGHVDAIVGGFPCQDISVAGKGAGLEGERSGLYWQIHRLAVEVRPTWLLLENVPALRTRGADDVLLSLAEAGYVAWPFVVGADDLGASHRRKRVWIVAYTDSNESERWREFNNVAGAESTTERDGKEWERMRNAFGDCNSILANADSVWQQQPGGIVAESGQWIGNRSQKLADASSAGRQKRDTAAVSNQPGHAAGSDFARWPARPGQPQYEWEEPRTVESQMGQSTHGFPERLAGRHRVAALKALGNAVVPQVAEVIGRAILQMEVAA